ncbi:aldo/keto reductase [Vineibacter terrae]|uniref:Aldo/keto reductase n=1 Tax=Vineibacter terrae TaxID=2586908 RepID=A0A5C8PGI7_9HYPH|nr:aldo/keto reductase [Vineibacter terrae]TXL72293.1 aldo/keto reductase [Vineibacter terrae]
MKQITLPGTDLRVSRFSFGTASLLRVGSQRERHRLLAAAYDNGFTHFDTAPYYGFGVAEHDLRAVLAARPEATVATKVGLYSPAGEQQPAPLVVLRKAVGKIIPAVSRPIVDWSVERARVALSASLRRLGRERVDLYLLHEPELHLLDTDEWLRWLEGERDRVRWFGIALNTARLGPFVQEASPLAPVIQTFDSTSAREADIVVNAGRPLQMTYGYVSAARQEERFDINALLGGALQRNRTGSIIVSTRKIDRLAQYGDIAARSDTGDS